MSSPMGKTKTIPLNPTHLVHHNYSFNCITSQKLQALSLCVQHIYVVGTGGCFFLMLLKKESVVNVTLSTYSPFFHKGDFVHFSS